MFTPSSKRNWVYWVRLLAVGLVGGVLLVLTGWEALYIRWVITPQPSTLCYPIPDTCPTPADLGLAYQDVTFNSTDGVLLSGWYLPPPERPGAVVVLLHGYGANRAEMLSRAEMLARRGFGVLLYDARGHGQSGGRQRTLGWREVNDLYGALDFLETVSSPSPAVGVLGFSVGGQVALRAAAQDERIRAVAADGPALAGVKDADFELYSDYERLSRAVNALDFWAMGLATFTSQPPAVVEEMERIAPRPLLLIVSGSDPFEPRITRLYYERAGQPKQFWQTPSGTHGEGVRLYPNEYAETIGAFFEQIRFAPPPGKQ